MTIKSSLPRRPSLCNLWSIQEEGTIPDTLLVERLRTVHLNLLGTLVFVIHSLFADALESTKSGDNLRAKTETRLQSTSTEDLKEKLKVGSLPDRFLLIGHQQEE